ncbi:MAG: flagellar assembly protein A [Limnochordia bacterium]|jgi:predicted RNA-binding protein Jag
MNEWIGSAATIEEAIAKGLQELGAAREDVEIEVLEVPKKRFLGLAKGAARVRLIRKAQEPPQAPRQTRDGKVWVKDGVVGWEQPEEGGSPPRLMIDNRLTVHYQGRLMAKSVQLTEGIDGLSIVLPDDVEPMTYIEVSVDQDRLTAHLHWQLVPGVQYRLADQVPANAAQLRLEQTVLHPKPLTAEDALRAVQSEGIAYGLVLAEVDPDVFKQAKGSIVAARGLPPVPPQNASIEYVFQDRNEIDLEAIRIDYYEVHGISSVEAGTVLAVKHPPVPGKPGIDVFGRPIPVAQPKDQAIKCGRGVELSTDGNSAIAAVAGLPHLKGNTLEVLPVLELNSDADISTGNISFDGAIVIRGSVLENVKVESHSGTVHVGGLVSGATIRSRGSIVVYKNVVSSDLQAGGLSIVQMKLASMLHNIRDYIAKLERAYHAVSWHGKNVSETLLLNHLLELKFPKLLAEVAALGDLYSEVSHQLRPELHEIVARLMVSLNPKGTRSNLELATLTRLAEHLAEEEHILSIEAVVDADIRARYLQNSRLEAAGSVIIEGQGAYYSTVTAGKGFHMERGPFRGGSIVVNSGNVTLKELGGPTGVATSVTIVSNGRIKCQTVHSNVTITIAQQRYRFDEPALNVQAYLVDGSLVVHGNGIKLVGE